MHRRAGKLGIVGLLIVLISTNLAAQQTACTLLTAADILATTGETAGPPNKMDVPIHDGPQRGLTTLGCMWSGNSGSMVTAMVMPPATGAVRDSSLAKIRRSYDELKKNHWTEERRDFANGTCSIFSPPPGKKDTPIMSQCVAETKGKAVAVGFMSPTRKPSLGQMKALLDRMVARLP